MKSNILSKLKEDFVKKMSNLETRELGIPWRRENIPWNWTFWANYKDILLKKFYPRDIRIFHTL